MRTSVDDETIAFGHFEQCSCPFSSLGAVGGGSGLVNKTAKGQARGRRTNADVEDACSHRRCKLQRADRDLARIELGIQAVGRRFFQTISSFRTMLDPSDTDSGPIEVCCNMPLVFGLLRILIHSIVGTMAGGIFLFVHDGPHEETHAECLGISGQRYDVLPRNKIAKRQLHFDILA